MSYKNKFEESEHKVHYKNIATKILRDMSTFRSSAEHSLTMPRRWIWELIQNAKDVAGSAGVKIKIEYMPNANLPFVKFIHTGGPFSADNIRFLIEQVSSKDRKKDSEGKQKSTGKFGTGFLSTHLLSEVVTVQGIAKEPELDYRQFTLNLDRSGFDIDKITSAVQNAKESINNLDDAPTYTKYKEGNFNTSFTYPLSDDLSLKIAKAGIEDLHLCLPYTFAFVPEIISIEVDPLEKKYINDNDLSATDDVLTYHVIKEVSKGEENITALACFTKGFTSIAVPISLSNDDQISLLPIDDKIPRLYCDFPLIGAERFPFPAVINNPNFNATDPRDGVMLNTSQRANPEIEENKQYMKEALELYFHLLNYAGKNNWKDLHLLANIHLPNSLDWIDPKWYTDNVLNPIRQKLLTALIVETANNNLASIIKDGKTFMFFPSGSDKHVRARIWKLAKSWFPHAIPQENDIELWNKLAWKECGKLTIEQLAIFIEHAGSIGELTEQLIDIDPYDWLNEFYRVLKMEKTEYDSIINKKKIFPNQNGDFCLKAKLNKDDGTIKEEFKDILKLLRNDIRENLMDDNIESDFASDKIWNQTFAVKEIVNEVTEKTNDREVARAYKEAFKKLLIWFKNNQEDANKLFPNLYKRKHLLYDDDEILDNVEKAEQLDDLLKEYSANNLVELRELLSKGQNNKPSLLPVTEKILLSMGISSLEEWNEAMKDENLAEKYSHESTPTTDMFVYVQSLIDTAKKNIIQHLSTLPNYDITQLDQSTARTVLADIQKDGQPLTIIARPAYNGEVIIYYGSERDILDYEPSELWIDDGKTPRRISLGHILKMGQIVKFPI